LIRSLSPTETKVVNDPRLLDQLPVIIDDLARLPEDLERELFAGFQLQVRYHQPTRRVTLRVTIGGDAIPRLTATSEAIMAKRGLLSGRSKQQGPPAASAVGGPRSFSLAGCAPGQARTCADVAGSEVARRTGEPDATINLARLEAVAKCVGVDVEAPFHLVDLAAVSMSRLAWRDGPVEDWHAVPLRRITDAEIMRANAATTRLLRDAMRPWLPGVLTATPEIPGAVELFAEGISALADPGRRLPDGRTLREWAPDAERLAQHQRHVRRFSVGLGELVAEQGFRETVVLLACYAAVYCWRWWLTPGWPKQVEESVRRLADPGRWVDGEMRTYARRLGPPPDGVTADTIRALLLAGPDLLDADTAAYCLRVGVGSLLPQDLGMQPIARKAIPAGYLRLVLQLAVIDADD
jgi:hypothetical protein